jgi:hypothetical protein
VKLEELDIMKHAGWLRWCVLLGAPAVAGAAPVFSVAPGGPSGLDPDKIYMPTPGGPVEVGGGSGSGLGLPGDDLDGLSSSVTDEEWVFCWSVAPGSTGSRSPVRGLLPPFDLSNQAANNQQTGDGFITTEAWNQFGLVPGLGFGLFTNALAINQGGSYFLTLGLLPDVDPDVVVPPGTPLDDLNAEAGPINPDEPLPALYFTVSQASPSLANLPAGPIPSGADIFFDPDVTVGGDEQLFVPAQALGLIVTPDPDFTDDIDALIVRDTDGSGLFDPLAGDFVIFSLKPGSPTLGKFGASAADLFISDIEGLRVLASGSQMGLAADDDLNAARTVALIGPDVPSTFSAIFSDPGCPGDANGDNQVDLADLNLVLANFGTAGPDGDVNGDGQVDLADLNLVLANFGTTCDPPA